MRFGPITERMRIAFGAFRNPKGMPPQNLLPFLLFCALALLSGCERKDSRDSAKSPEVAPKARDIANPSQAATNATEMLQIRGGKFMMGDKDEVDAPPHEVVVSSFAMDKYLVTQAQFQKIMGSNPSRWKGDKN